MTDTQNGGVKFDYVKGAIGTVILGSGGAVAGIKNTTQTVYKCPDCGMTLTYCMPEELKIMIDVGVESASARNKLTFHGIPMDWNALTKQYKNIESGNGDKEVQRQRMLVEEREMNKQKLLTHITDKFLEKISEIQTEIEIYLANIENNKEHGEELQKAWEEIALPIIEQKKHEQDVAMKKIEDEYNFRLRALKATTADWLKPHNEKKQSLLREEDELLVKYYALGFLKFSEKKATKARLDAIKIELSTVDEKIEEETAFCKRAEQRNITKAKQQREEKERESLLNIEKKYTIPENPAVKIKRGAFWTNAIEGLRTRSNHDDYIKDILGCIFVYLTLSIMQEMTGSRGIVFNYILPTSLKERSFNLEDADTIMDVAMPKLCETFNINNPHVYEGYAKMKTRMIQVDKKLVEAGLVVEDDRGYGYLTLL